MRTALTLRTTLAIGFIGTACPSSGAVVVSYQNPVTGNAELEPAVGSEFSSYVTPTSFSIGAGLVYRGDGSTYNSAVLAGDEILVGVSGADGSPQSIADAISSDQYVELGFSVSGLPSGFAIDLTSFTYGVRRNYNAIGNNTRASGAVFYQPLISIDGSSFDPAGSVLSLPIGPAAAATSDFTPADLFSGALLQNGDSVLVRMYFAQFNETGGFAVIGEGASRYGNIVFNGSLVPEPSVGLLCFIGMACPFLRRRRLSR